MPLELLQTLTDDELPLELFLAPEVQDKLRILHDAGHIICSFPPADMARSKPVLVHMVTPLGRKALRYFGPKQAHCRNEDSPRREEKSSASAGLRRTLDR